MAGKDKIIDMMTMARVHELAEKYRSSTEFIDGKEVPINEYTFILTSNDVALISIALVRYYTEKFKGNENDKQGIIAMDLVHNRIIPVVTKGKANKLGGV